MTKSGIFLGALGVCVAVALVVGLAGAAAVTPHFAGNVSKNDIATWQSHGVPGRTIVSLKPLVVDGSVQKTAIRNSDLATLKSWLKKYGATNYQNPTGNKNLQNAEKIFTYLDEQGINVSEPKNYVESGDMDALKFWALGNIISHLEEQGVDVSVPREAIQNDDMVALQTWVEAYLMQQGVDVSVPRTAIQNGDMLTLQSWVEAYLTQQGVDVSVPREAIENGDMTALETWIDQYRVTFLGEISGNK